MNTRASKARRDGVAACVLTLAVVALLFTWSPSLRPGFSPLRVVPPTITYCPAALTASDHQEPYDESPDGSTRYDRDPSLIALSAAMMLPPAKSGQANAVTPPLDAAYSLLRFPDKPPMERYEQIPVLTPPRSMTPLGPQRLAASALTRHPSPAPPSCWVELTGDWQGRSVDLSPMSALSEPAGSWSFTAVLRYDEAGRVQHALLESAMLDQPLRDEIVRRLYQCRVTPSGASGEGRLTVSGPGRAARP